MKAVEVSKITDFEQKLQDLGVDARTLNAAEKKQLDEQGYLIFTRLFSPKEVKELQAEFERLHEDDRANAHITGNREGGTRHVHGVLSRSELFDPILLHPKYLAAAGHLFGKEFRAGDMHGRDPLPGFGLQSLHADAADRYPFHTINSIWLLDDFTVKNGGTRFVPGSHHDFSKWRSAMKSSSYNHPEQKQVEAPAGSVFIFNAHLLHSGMPNNTQQSRRAMLYALTTSTQFFYGTAAPEVMARFSPAARYLLGDRG
jgi:ectoine hydroxylase-related dioxygenase (phytanoyl-CoA dioxygenase family)